MKAHVSQILTENGRVMGVRVGQKEQSAVDLYAPIVISDAGSRTHKTGNVYNNATNSFLLFFFPGLQNTFQDLLPENVAKLSPSWSLANSLPAALGNLTVFIGLKGTPEDLGLTAQNVWIFTNHHPIDVRSTTSSSSGSRSLLMNDFEFQFGFYRNSRCPSLRKLCDTFAKILTRQFSFRPPPPKILRGPKDTPVQTTFQKSFEIFMTI
jgi:all-trans-retinol 13,14-reductase